MSKQILIGVLAGITGILLVFVARPSQQASPALQGFWINDPVEPPTMATSIFPTTEPAWKSPDLDQIVEEIDFENATLAEALNWIADRMHGSLVVHWWSIEMYGSKRSETINLSLRHVHLRTVLRLVLDAVSSGLKFVEDRGVVVVTISEDWDQPVEVRVYDVRDLMLDAMRFSRAYELSASAHGRPASTQSSVPYEFSPDRLASSLYRGSAGSPAHDEAGMVAWLANILSVATRTGTLRTSYEPAIIQYWAGKFIIAMDAEGHKKIEEVLRALRQQGQTQ